jgi:vitamin B12 transporter
LLNEGQEKSSSTKIISRGIKLIGIKFPINCMLKLLIFIIGIFIYESTQASEIVNETDCTWDNRKEIPCLNIISNVSNSSEFTKSGINKTIITKKQILESGAIDIIDVLKSIPDINITQSGPMGQQASMFMRGTNSNHTLVMINGVPINDQSATQGLHDFGVDFIQTIHQIEVYPGSSASHFGSNAIGGAVNIVLTGDFKDSISIGYDKNNNYELAANKSFILDNSSLNIKVGSVKDKSISVRGNSKDEKDGIKNYTTNINYENFLDNNNKIFNTIYLRQTISEYDNSVSNQSGYEGDNKMGSFQFGLENTDSKSKKNYTLFYNIYDREYDERSIIDTYESEALGVKFSFSKTFNNKISLGTGSEYKYDWGQFDNQGSYQASTKGHVENLSIYGNLGWNFFERYNMSLFLRNDNHKKTGNELTYKINLEQAFDNINLGASFMNGIRNPTLYELFGTDNFGYSGNENLKPEKSNTFEVYSKINLNENLNISIRGFRSNIKNNIEYISNKYQNDSDDVDLNQSGINSNFELTGKNSNINIFSSFLSSEKENGASNTRRPEKNYGIILKNKFNKKYIGNFNLNLKYNHYGKHFDVHSSSFNTIEMDSTDIIDLYLTKEIHSTTYFLKISNILNEDYQRPHGYNQIGRALKFGFKF